MATSSRLAREQTEKAFAAYLNDHRGSALDGIPVQIRKGKFKDDGTLELENLDEIPLPCVAVACPRSHPHDGGWPVCELHILSLNSVDDENAATKASQRFGYIAALLGEENTESVMTSLNYRGPLPYTKFGDLDTMTVGGEPLVWDVAHGAWAPAGVDWDNVTGYIVAAAQITGDPYTSGLSILQYLAGAVVSSHLYPVIAPGVIVQDPAGPQITDFEPVTGIDSRAVRNFKVFGFYQTEDMGQETDRHWIDHLVFEVHCNPTDDIDGDGEDD
jgi:hypothetical protein